MSFRLKILSDGRINSCRKNMMKQKVVILGYSTQLSGGVTKVSSYLLSQVDELDLHPVLGCYHPFLKSIVYTLFSLLCWSWKLVKSRKKYKGVIVIIASVGDVIRTIPFIWVSLLFGLRVSSQFHSNTSILEGVWKHDVARYLILSTWKNLAFHTCLSDSLKKEYQAFLGADCKIIVIPNALERKWLNTQALAYTERTRDIVYFGRWSEEKGIYDLINAMKMVGDNIVCEIYSDPPAGISYDNCRLYPWVDEERVLEIMRTARLLVLPSYKEAYPTVLLEAIACRTPFIATRVGGIPDIVKQSNCGLLIEIGDVKGLATTITRLLKNENEWSQYSQLQSNWIQSHDIGHIAAKWRSQF